MRRTACFRCLITGDSIKALIDALNEHLLSAHAEGRRTILVVDEAQNLAPDVLEQVRLLTNLETSKQKLLQIILIGQPELRELLARNDLRQLAQRITGRYHLEPLTREETEQYIEHRLQVAGALGEVFDASARREVFRLTQGVPRLINVICDRALLGAFSIENRRVNRRIMRKAATEITGKAETANTMRRALPVVGIIAAVVISAGFLSLLEERKPAIEAATEAAAPAIKKRGYDRTNTGTGARTGRGRTGSVTGRPAAARPGVNQFSISHGRTAQLLGS